MVEFLHSGPVDAEVTVLLAHGAGAAMDTPFMNAVADGLAAHRIHTARFEFGYMASRRGSEGRKPPPRAETLKGEFRSAVEALNAAGPLLIGGKSMGGRVASMVAEDFFRQSRIGGLVCLGYPFHPPSNPDQLRTAHLRDIPVPTLICQGTRDPFGTKEEVRSYDLSSAIALHWLEDGDHDFRPRKASGLSFQQNLQSALDRIAGWVRTTLSA